MIERHCGIDRDTEPAERLTASSAKWLRAAWTRPKRSLCWHRSSASRNGWVISRPRPRAPSSSTRSTSRSATIWRHASATVPAYCWSTTCTGSTRTPSTSSPPCSTPSRGELLVVITARELDPVPGGSRVFDLKALTDTESDQLIAALGPELASDARNAVRSRCDGIPLYIEEVVTKLREQPSDAAEGTGVPDSIYEALFARLRSSENAVRVVEAAAICGGRFDRRLLVSASEIDEGSVDQVIGELVKGRVFIPLDEKSFRFRHELLRELAAELPPPTLQRRLHSRIADALAAPAAPGNPDWPLIASHYHAGRTLRRCRLRLSESLRGRPPPRRAQRGARSPQPRDRTRRAHPRGPTARQTRDRRATRTRLPRLRSARATPVPMRSPNSNGACSSSTASPGPALYATFNALWFHYSSRGDLRRGRELVEFDEETPSGAPTRPRLSATLRWACSPRSVASWSSLGRRWSRRRPRWRPARHTGSADLVLAQRPDRRHVLVSGDDTIPPGRSGRRRRRRCWRWKSDVSTLEFPRGPSSLCYGRALDSWIHIEAGQLDRADRTGQGTQDAQQAGRLRRMGDDRRRATRPSSTARERCSHERYGLVEQHVQALTAVTQGWRALELRTWLAFYDTALVRVLIGAGDLDAARAHVKLSLQMADETDIHFYDAELIRLRAQTSDDPADAKADLLTAIALARRQGAGLFELRAATDYFESCRRAGPGGAGGSHRQVAGHHRVARTGARASATRVNRSRATHRGPRRGHGGAGCRVAPQRTRLAGPVRIDHRLPARVAARRQGCVEPRRERADRGTRPARLARLVRERVRVAAGVLRRTRPCDNGSRRADSRLGRGFGPVRQPRVGGPMGQRLVGVAGTPLPHRGTARRTRYRTVGR